MPVAPSEQAAESERAALAVAGAPHLDDADRPVRRVAVPRPAADRATTLTSVTTLREGNTPLYELPRCAQAVGLNWLLAKHQGMNPTGSFKDTGMTAALSVARSAGLSGSRALRPGNTSAAMAAYAARAGLRQHRVYSRWQDCVGQAVAVDGLRRADDAAEDGLRWLREDADGTGHALSDLIC